MPRKPECFKVSPGIATEGVVAAPERLLAPEDLEARRALWHGVWDWVIRECERLASEQDATPPARHRTATRL